VEAQIELADIFRNLDMKNQAGSLLNTALKQARTIGQYELEKRIEDILQSNSSV
jgi:hypothetical protein